MTEPDVARQGWREALASYRNPTVLAMLLLGFSAGLPFLLVFSTLSAWLAQLQISKATIGLFAWVGLTYSIKVVWAPVIDRWPLPGLGRLGRRRGWMLLAQLGIVGGLLGIAATDPAESLTALAWWALLVAFSSATQDITVDAWRIEAAPPEQQGALAASYQLGYRIALIVAGAGCLLVASRAGWPAAYQVMALFGLVGVMTTLFVGDRAPPRELSTDSVLRGLQRAVVGPFVDFFARNGLATGGLILAFVGSFRLTDITMGVMANPFYLDMGYTLDQIAFVAKGYGVLMTIIGAMLGGVLVARLTAARALIVGGLLVIATNLCFAGLALYGEPALPGLVLVISADNLASGLAGTAFIAYLSGLTSVAYTATQYALFSSLFTLPGKLLAGGSGVVVETLGYVGFFFYTSLLGIPALLMIAVLLRRVRRLAQAP
ncbi:MAG: MFS transporter [Oceanococcaceae bacterium]